MDPDVIWMLAIIAFVGAACGMWFHFETERQRHVISDWRERRLHRGR